MPRPSRLAAAVTAALALSLLAAAPAVSDQDAPPQARVIAHFDLAAGQTPENIALEPDGSADLTFAFARQVARVTLNGDTRVLATLPAVANPDTPLLHNALVLGIARAHDGTLYVNYATGTSRTGVWRLAPDGSAPVQIAHLPANGLPNGLALDERRGVLYAADSVRGTVWRVPQRGGTPTAWATGTPLTPLPAPPASGFGANGIKVHHDAVWVSNTDRGTLLRIPVRPDGSAGPIETRASGLAAIDDFAFAGHHSDTVFAALIQANQVVRIRPDGDRSVVLTREDGLSNPTSVAVRGRSVYVPSAAYFTQQDPNLLLAHLRGHFPRLPG
ncbi:SMP-30/gluconolactonase/LRE family protein [Streptomyces griseosporeus]|uniref:SMP-30/gluconolactonase/LRE family protein n=1 Tax=Streptomyces griseosporeus TaxID=1910 RepID=UPI0036FA6F80